MTTVTATMTAYRFVDDMLSTLSKKASKRMPNVVVVAAAAAVDAMVVNR